MPGPDFVRLEAGTFIMGNSSGMQRPWYEDVPPKPVNFTRSFWIETSEVTQAAYKKVMDKNPSYYKGDALPVDSVTWKEAAEYCSKIGGRLPTEGEWEYAARAGIASDRYGDLDEIAWYGDNSGHNPHPVKGKHPNGSGLYDMLGNVTEWTATKYDVPPLNGTGPERLLNAKARALRGGAWDYPSASVTLWNRAWADESDRLSTVGFRCVSDTP
jgi:formylglycine-generating enzyme required for sulfatase activity